MRQDKGFALMVAIVILVLFATLGLVAVSLFSTDMHIALDTLRSAQAFFLAEAGLEYALEALSHDSDWRDNSDITKGMANGTFNIHYITQTINYATLKFTGTKDNVSRKFSVNINKNLSAFDYVLYIGGEVNDQDATNLKITGKIKESATDLPSVDFAYYETIAEHKVYENTIFAPGVYSGIWYVDGNVTVGSGVTINGSIIATGNIDMKNNNNISVIAVLPYPALVANGNFSFQNASNITIDGTIYVGANMTGNFLAQKAENINITGTVIVAGNFNLQNSEDITITYRAQEPVPGFSGEGFVSYNTWQETN